MDAALRRFMNRFAERTGWLPPLVVAGATAWPWPRKVAIWSAAALACLLIGFSRLYLAVEWPTDVLAGYALGALWAAMCLLAIRHPRAEPAEPHIT